MVQSKTTYSDSLQRKRRVSVDLTPLQTAKFLQKWADQNDIEVLIAYQLVGKQFEMNLLLSKVNLEFKGNGQDIGMSLNHLATRALLKLVEMEKISFADMPNNIISVLKYEAKTPL